MVGLIAQGGLELHKAAGAAEIDPVEPRHLVGSHEVVVGLDRRVLRPEGDDPDDIAGDSGGVVALEDADPLVALLDVEPAQVFIAADGVADALVPQMGRAQIHPFIRKFRICVQQGHEIGGKGGTPPGSLRTGDGLCRHLDHTHVHPARHHGVVQDFVQDLGVGVAPVEDAVLVIFLALLEGLAVLLQCFLSAQKELLLCSAGRGGPLCLMKSGSL